MLWLEFAAISAVIVYSGWKLTNAVDQYADLVGAGKLFLGMILVGAVTSLPELATSTAALVVVESPDIAAGNIYGSNCFDIFIIAIIDFFVSRKSMLAYAGEGNVLTSGFIVMITAFTMLAYYVRQAIGDSFVLFGIGIESAVLTVGYFAAAYSLFMFERKPAPEQEEIPADAAAIRGLRWTIGVYSLIILIFGTFLAVLGDQISEATGIGRSFVGSVLVAGATSLPEVVVSVAAVRMMSYEIALGNIVGSCLFNLLIFPISELMYRKAPLFGHMSESNMIPAIISIMLQCVIVVGIKLRQTKDFPLRDFEKWAITVMYLGGSYILFEVTRAG